MKLTFLLSIMISFSTSVMSQDYSEACVDALFSEHTDIPSSAINFCKKVKNKYQLGCVTTLLKSYGDIPVYGLKKCGKFNNSYSVRSLRLISGYANSLPVVMLKTISKVSTESQLSCVKNLLTQNRVNNSQIRACTRL